MSKAFAYRKTASAWKDAILHAKHSKAVEAKPAVRSATATTLSTVVLIRNCGSLSNNGTRARNLGSL